MKQGNRLALAIAMFFGITVIYSVAAISAEGDGSTKTAQSLEVLQSSTVAPPSE